MIILAASAFFSKNIQVEELSQAQDLLTPLVGNSAGVIFAVALLFAGISSTITSGIAGASVFAGFFGEAYSPKDFIERAIAYNRFYSNLSDFFTESDG